MAGNVLGSRLRERRIELGLSQRALGMRLGVSRALIVQLEDGRSPWRGLWRRLAIELDLDEAELVRDGRSDGPARSRGLSDARRSELDQ